MMLMLLLLLLLLFLCMMMMPMVMPMLPLISFKQLVTFKPWFPQFHFFNICCGRGHIGPSSGGGISGGNACGIAFGLKLTWLTCLYALMWYGLTTAKLTAEAGSHMRLTQRNNHANISELLDNLLRGYDNSIRPDFGGPPATVEVDIMVRSMGPISEVDMTYSMDCYFRQSWVDKRLAFKGAQDTLALSVSMLARIWKPDTYFYNGKQSYLHTITTPNKFVRIHQDGRVLYSSRLTIKAGCPMNLEDFPMDIQKCPLKFGSSEYSMLMVNFHLQRHMGNFLIQVYGPCCLLVVLSWVSFWLNREATADRVSLGITTVLTMTFLGLEARTDLPKVPYPTALDFFVFLSFAFIFATILQFAVVHYFTKYGSGECYFIIEELDSDTEAESAVRQTPKLGMTPDYTPTESTESKIYEVIPLSMCSINIPNRREAKRRRSRYERRMGFMNCWRQLLNWSGGRQSRGRHKPHFESSDEDGEEVHLRASEDITPKKYSGRRRMSYYRREELDARRKGKRTPQYNSVSKIDRASRIVFPILFLLINVFYWYGYLSRSSRILAPSNTTT
ncbi:gamma-aminobutyric acid receptor alpha-like isoform X3 [Stomoxys calcitrans]|uniref:gamma-aminobutyric acid receptor alpha-like isoform X3 n=1 Tax=Stomoxys calcitrans TaxID=35570 RepID=UPI0027E21B5B|nr:gamma-aminobutyric acid receptor alpha-like isoform X3 [Stomoxys calcitrans]